VIVGEIEHDGEAVALKNKVGVTQLLAKRRWGKLQREEQPDHFFRVRRFSPWRESPYQSVAGVADYPRRKGI